MNLPGTNGPAEPPEFGHAALDAERDTAEREALARFRNRVQAAVDAAPADPAAFETHVRAEIVGAFNELDNARAAAHAADPRNNPATTP